MILAIGAVCFGLVAGYITYRTLVRTTKNAQISDLTAVLSAIGGGAVTALFHAGSDACAWYAIGPAAGMVLYFALFLKLNGRKHAAVVLGGGNSGATAAETAPR